METVADAIICGALGHENISSATIKITINGRELACILKVLFSFLFPFFFLGIKGILYHKLFARNEQM